MIDGKFCVRKAFIDLQRVSSYKKQCASSCNCEFCRSQRQKRIQTGQQLRERLEAIDREAKKNRQIREQRQLEYDKTVRLLQLMNRH
jgi:biotin synthase-like enzyme